jgi:hypothetical protein
MSISAVYSTNRKSQALYRILKYEALIATQRLDKRIPAGAKARKIGYPSTDPYTRLLNNRVS